jgi:hypothetical protein
MTFQDIKLFASYYARRITKSLSTSLLIQSEGRVLILKSSRSLDTLADLAVFTGCTSGAVCFTSYLQCAQSEIFGAQNSKYVNIVIILNLNIYCRQENCAVLG